MPLVYYVSLSLQFVSDAPGSREGVENLSERLLVAVKGSIEVESGELPVGNHDALVVTARERKGYLAQGGVMKHQYSLGSLA